MYVEAGTRIEALWGQLCSLGRFCHRLALFPQALKEEIQKVQSVAVSALPEEPTDPSVPKEISMHLFYDLGSSEVRVLAK